MGVGVATAQQTVRSAADGEAHPAKCSTTVRAPHGYAAIRPRIEELVALRARDVEELRHPMLQVLWPVVSHRHEREEFKVLLAHIPLEQRLDGGALEGCVSTLQAICM